MAWQSFKIEKYEAASFAYNTPGYSGISGYIHLFWEGDKGATLWFYRDIVSSAFPNFFHNAAGAYYAKFAHSQFPHAIDLLRNEKPVFFQWSDSTGARLSTQEEPVGEEELP